MSNKHLKLPKAVVMNELILDEGFQYEKHIIPTEAKVWLHRELIKVGFKSLAVSNFGNPRFLRNSRDCEELYRQIGPPPGGVDIVGRTPNLRALDRVIALRKEGFGPNWVGTGIATTDYWQKFFSGVTIEEQWTKLPPMIKAAHDAGLKFESGIAGTFSCIGCGVKIPPEIVLSHLDKLVSMDVDSVAFAEGHMAGQVAPTEVYELFSRILDKYPKPEFFGFHFHDAYGWGVPCILAAMQAGWTHFDTCFGGLSGPASIIQDGVPTPAANAGIEPPMDFYRVDSPQGVLPTEDIASICDAMGVDTGLDIGLVLNLGRWVEQIVGHRTFSRRLKWSPPWHPFRRLRKESQWNVPTPEDLEG